MILLEFSTESGSTYLVDVVNCKLKRLVVHNKPQSNPEWYEYKKLVGTGVIGTPMQIVWNEHQVSGTTPVKALRFVNA